MPSGLQVFRESTGQIIFDSNSQLGRLVGSITTGFVAGSVAANLTTGTPFAFAVLVYANGTSPNFGTPGGAMLQPTLTVTGSSVAWSFPANSGSYQNFQSCIIYYGVY